MVVALFLCHLAVSPERSNNQIQSTESGHFFAFPPFTFKNPHLNPKVFLQQRRQVLWIFFVSFHLNARIGSVPRRHCQVFRGSIWSQARSGADVVSILGTARGAANGSQPSIPADQDVLLHPPIYWNPSSNVSESIFLY